MGRRRIILLLADGSRPDVLGALLADGALPAIAAAFPEPAMRREATTVFPSTTGPAFLPFLTGCYPGRLNMPGIRWFDRAAWAERNGAPSYRSYVGLESFRMNADLAAGRPTLFEILPRSVNIFSSVNRGVPRRGNLTALSRAAWWGYAHETSRWDRVSERARRHLLAALDLDPEFVFCLVPDIDNMSHLSHCRSDIAIAAYRRFDRTVGDLFAELDRRRWRDDTLVMVVSDHGHMAVQAHLGLPEWVGRQGMRPFYYPRIWRREFDSAVMVSGNGMAHVHVRRGREWSAEPAWDDYLRQHCGALLDALVARPEIGLVATRRADGTVVIRSRAGMAFLRRTADGRLDYRAEGGDPLGYDGLDGVWHPDDVLAATWRTRYPDGPVQLMQVFDSSRSGDIVVSAEPGYDLRDTHERPEHRSGHGALHEEHLRVPWLSTAPLPDVPLRTVDAFPFVLRWVGKPIPSEIDGRDLANLEGGLSAASRAR